jgi:N-acetylglucosamine-6-phosphate deacetylase
MAQAFIADRVVTPEGTRRAAVLLEDGPAGMAGLIRAVCAVGELPATAKVVDFGAAALLPGLVDSRAGPSGRVSQPPHAPRLRAVTPPWSTCR